MLKLIDKKGVYISLIIFAYTIAIFGIIICFIIEPSLARITPGDLRLTLSQYGIYKNTEIIFNGSLIIAGIVGGVGLYGTMKDKKSINNISKFLIVYSYSIIALIGLITYEANYNLHVFIAIWHFFGVSAAMLIQLKYFNMQFERTLFLGFTFITITWLLISFFSLTELAYTGQFMHIIANVILMLYLIFFKD